MRILSLVLSVLAASAVVADDLKFAIYGDWGVGQNFIYKDDLSVKGVSLTGAQAGHLMSKTEQAVVTQFQAVSDQFQPQFILSTGDQFYDDGLFSLEDPQFRTKFKDVYTSPGVNVTWYPCLGNHDYYQSPTAELNRTNDDWRWYFPSKYYNFSYFANDTDQTEVLFVVMDVTPGLYKYRDEKGIKDASSKYYRKQLVQNLQAEKALGTWATQLAWAQQVLSNSTAKWKFVMVHEPLYATYDATTPNSPANGNTFGELQHDLQPLLEMYNVSAVLSGHFHTLDITENNNIAYIISGAASQIPYPVGNGTKEGLIDYFQQNNITGVYDPDLSNVTPPPIPNGTTTRYPTDPAAPARAKPQKQIFMGGNENNLPGFMNARVNTTHLSIDVWGMWDNHTWGIVYQYVKQRIDLIPSTPSSSSSTGPTTTPTSSSSSSSTGVSSSSLVSSIVSSSSSSAVFNTMSSTSIVNTMSSSSSITGSSSTTTSSSGSSSNTNMTTGGTSSNKPSSTLSSSSSFNFNPSSSSSGLNNANMAINMTPMWGMIVMLVIALLA